jgi:hypothetical protein
MTKINMIDIFNHKGGERKENRIIWHELIEADD